MANGLNDGSDMARRETRRVLVGGTPLGGGAPISVQTMNRSAFDDVEGNLRELQAAANAGCDIGRMAVPSVAAVPMFGKVAARSPIPVVADVHFDWRVALAAVAEGAAKVRVNPGNMGRDGLARLSDAAGAKGIPVRIGVNSGSALAPGETPGRRTMAEIMVKRALEWVDMLRDFGFRDVVLSFKAHSVRETVLANRLAAGRCSLPLHVGMTAAGGGETAMVKSVATLGSLLLDGIGDTIRVGITGDLAGEARVGVSVLKALELRRKGPEFCACPTCGRTRVDLAELLNRVEDRLAHLEAPLRIAVMGCEVNGPGEASSADLGLAASGGIMYLFKKGAVVRKVKAEEAVDALATEAEEMAVDYGG
ncbi:MAG: flavodoxin-dependent (E)-4-hydroxy-3-methylbut-2-enyl-diphosphate synthase [Planctomycetota bacterium]|nr:flavodoxin-dependent (E)-4-hydroxy-3-methylbut-2-enyl-diphosphate synthase [Planctomycetota bacterium]